MGWVLASGLILGWLFGDLWGGCLVSAVVVVWGLWVFLLFSSLREFGIT